jgi:hypothetical protein
LTGLARQLSGVHRSDMTSTPEQKPLLIRGSEGPGYTQAGAGPPVPPDLNRFKAFAQFG